MESIDNFGLSRRVRNEFDKLGYSTAAIFCDTSKKPDNFVYIGFREDYIAYAVLQVKD